MFAFLMIKETLSVFRAQRYNDQCQGINTVNLTFEILHSALHRKLISIADLTGRSQFKHQGRQTRSVMNMEVGKKHHEPIFSPTPPHFLGYKLPFSDTFLKLCHISEEAPL